jgi:hypothetical protein
MITVGNTVSAIQDGQIDGNKTTWKIGANLRMKYQGYISTSTGSMTDEFLTREIKSL